MSVDTPFYYYDMRLLDRTLAAVKKAASTDERFRVHYAVKANADKEILETISRADLGADCVSGWEIEAAVAAGFPAEKIVFAGVGKTDREIELALRAGIGCFNVESMQELEVIGAIASDLGMTASVALRVNPNIDAHTHEYITTGLSENKFGINLDQLESHIKAALAIPSISLEGLHFHIGSQITETEPFEMLCETINKLQQEYASLGITFRNINVGGGLGIDYADPSGHPIPDFDRYFSVFRNNLKVYPGQKVHFELGRSVVAQCGSLITRVLYIKEGSVKRFAIVDAGMTDLIRPALYNAYHKIEKAGADFKPVHVDSDTLTESYDIVGPICESSDCFSRDVRLPVLHRGDLLMIRSAGAYGRVMASQYNLRPIPHGLYCKN